MTNKTAYILLVVSILLGCTAGPKPIEYGADKCDFCRMTIVDRQFAAELVTSKGRVYKFDAIECLLDWTEQNPETEIHVSLVNDYTGQGELVDATGCTYLISKQLPSPMGAFLSAYARGADAELYKERNEGELYSWEELRRHRNKKDQ